MLDGSEDDNTDGDNDPATNPTDTDGDGIIDKKDADPLRPEDFDGFQDVGKLVRFEKW